MSESNVSSTKEEVAVAVAAAQRGSVAFADQANACVSTYTTPLDPHERPGPARATPGVGNLRNAFRCSVGADLDRAAEKPLVADR